MLTVVGYNEIDGHDFKRRSHQFDTNPQSPSKLSVYSPSKRNTVVNFESAADHALRASRNDTFLFSIHRAEEQPEQDKIYDINDKIKVMRAWWNSIESMDNNYTNPENQLKSFENVALLLFQKDIFADKKLAGEYLKK